MDFLPAVSGLLMEQELEYPGRATDNPAHPYAAILGEPQGQRENRCDREFADAVRHGDHRRWQPRVQSTVPSAVFCPPVRCEAVQNSHLPGSK